MNQITRERENPAVFYKRFSRGRKLLRFIAHRVLRRTEQTEEAIRNCFIAASRNPPRLESEGAFHCWLIRILIHEALLIRRDAQNKSAACSEPLWREQ